MLQLQTISKVYRGRGREVTAIDKLSLELPVGKLAVLQGPSGCGKTTLLLAAGGLMAPDSGKVVVDGTDLYQLTPEERARVRANKIGFVFQQFHLIPYLTVLENVKAPLLAGGESGAGYAEELLERFGLTQRRWHLPGELSTGERQRTALARALMNRPRLLLADEPTGNLDTDNAGIVLDALERFAADGGAVLVVSHDERAVARGKLVWRMESGKLLLE